MDLTDLSTALGILANNGTKGAEAGTAMNAMLVRMTSKDVAMNAMKSWGVSAFDAAGNFRGLENSPGGSVQSYGQPVHGGEGRPICRRSRAPTITPKCPTCWTP